MNKIRMVALDLDGTTLNSNKEISPRTVKAFKEAMNKGVHIVISTGRTFHSLPKQLFTIDGLEYVVTSNGAHITRLADMSRIYEKYVDADAVEEIVSILRKTPYSVETFVGGKAYIDKADFDEVVAHGSTFRDAEYIKSTRNPIPQLYDFMLEHKTKIENISINFPHPKDKEIISKLLEPVENITLTSSFVHNYEIGGPDTSKGEALKYLMKLLDVHKDQLMACGDSPNDGEMIKLAGIGVIVENGMAEMKEMADFVTASNNDDGVAKAIEKFVL